MALIFDYAIKRNGALAWLLDQPTTLGVLVAYSMFADDYNNAWPGTYAPQGPDDTRKAGALHIATGLAERTLIEQRTALKDHGVLHALTSDQVRAIYYGEDWPKDKGRPPLGSVKVWHINNQLEPCKAGCNRCTDNLLVAPLTIFYDATPGRHLQKVSRGIPEKYRNSKGGGNQKSKTNDRQKIDNPESAYADWLAEIDP